MVIKDHYKNKIETGEAIRSVGLYSEGFGKLDKEGDLYVVGREKDLMMIMGQGYLSPRD